MRIYGLRSLQPLLLGTAAVLHLACGVAVAHAQLLDVVAYAPDITVDLGGTVVEAGVLASDDLQGSVTLLALPNLPAGARIAAAHRSANSDLLLAFDSTLALPGGGGIAEPRDVVQFTTATQSYSIRLHGADLGLPTNVAIDALGGTPSGTILISLDGSVGAFDDEDVIAVDGTTLSLFLDVSAVGVDAGLDVDGIAYAESGDALLYLSFDGSGTVDGVAFDDEDVLLYDMTTQTWSLAYDGSAAAAHWPDAADLTAINVVLAPPPTATPSATPLAPTATDTATSTGTPTEVPPTATATATATTAAATGTATANASDTPTAPESTRTASHTPTAPEPTRTASNSPTAPEPTRTASNSPTQSSSTSTPTAPATQTPTGPVATGTATATSTPTPSGSIGTATTTASATAVVTIGPGCVGDCNGSGEVTINELITLVNIALGDLPVGACLAGDADQDGAIAINELVTAVGHALNGCP